MIVILNLDFYILECGIKIDKIYVALTKRQNDTNIRLSQPLAFIYRTTLYKIILEGERHEIVIAYVYISYTQHLFSNDRSPAFKSPLRLHSPQRLHSIMQSRDARASCMHQLMNTIARMRGSDIYVHACPVGASRCTDRN